MKAIFVSGPITAPTYYQVNQNIRRAEQVAVKLMRKGWAVHCPHKNSEFLQGALHKDLEEDFEAWITIDIEWVSRCDAVFMLKGWRRSRGAKLEHKKAKEFGKAIYYEENGDLIGNNKKEAE